MLTSVELFAGAGGLGMGMAMAGFRHLAVVERDRQACETIRENQRRAHPLVAAWPLHAADVRDIRFEAMCRPVDVVAGGPPCQPFSICGNHAGYDDTRDMFPATADVVRRLRPRAFLVENVKGLTRPGFADYFSYILARLEFPEIGRKSEEDWNDHLRRLRRQKASGRRGGLTYTVASRILNAVDFGVPQKRERVFIVGFRDDLDIRWSFPRETHFLDALLSDQWMSEDYWDRHEVARTRRGEPPPGLGERIARLRRRDPRPGEERRAWRTVRDALAGLPDPETSPDAASAIQGHRFQPGVRFYAGHTGSPLDLPAKTLKAGDHGVPGGENALVRPDGGGRYFTVREAARLQTFRDDYVFPGGWSEAMRQIGNAVPVSLAHAVGASVARALLERDVRVPGGTVPGA